MRYFSSLYFLLFLGLPVSAQDFDNYTPLRASGRLPAEFSTSSTARYQEDRQSIGKESGRFERKLQDKFYLESSFAVDQLMLSGKVLFNDPIGNYLNKVADEILKNNPALRSKVRFYVIKSAGSNAFTTQRGAIFVTMGMLARIENEAQLAFILCHEIAHFQAQHVLKSYVQKTYIQEDKGPEKGRYKKTNDLEKMIMQSAYSQENEKQADLNGLELYLQTGYSTDAVSSVFDVLIRDVERPISPLFRGYHDIFSSTATLDDWENHRARVEKTIEDRQATPSSGKPVYLLEGVAGPDGRKPDTEEEEAVISENETVQINLSSHPDADEREQLVAARLPGEHSGKLFLVSETEYVQVRDMALFEMSNLLVVNGAYFDALYLILGLMGDYPDSKYLKKELVKALYGYAQYYTQNRNVEKALDYTDLDQPFRELELFLDACDHAELNLIALAKTWDLLEEMPQDPYCKAALKDQIFDLMGEYPDFSKMTGEASGRSIAVVQQVTGRLMANPQFVAIHDQVRQDRVKRDEFDAFLESKKGSRYKQSYYRKIRKKGYRLGIDKAVVFNPSYHRIQIRNKKQNPVQHVAGEQQQNQFGKYILKAGADLGLDITYLDSRSTEAKNQAEVFNDLTVLEAWQAEKALHDETDMVCSNYGEIQQLVEKYQTPYFVNMGVISVRSKFSGSGFLGLYPLSPLVFFPVMWPYVGYEIGRPEEVSIVYSLVYNMEEGKLIAAPYNAIRVKIKNEMLYNSLHFDLHQLKRKKRK